MAIERIISGGQTGVDRAALDAAHACGVPSGGWCPQGRRADDGPIPAHYPLRETPTVAYAQRTAWNVRDSDGTLVLLIEAPEGGTALTIEEAQRRGRPWRVVRLPADPALTRTWICEQSVRTLNVAGPRASEAQGVYAAAFAFLTELLGE